MNDANAMKGGNTRNLDLLPADFEPGEWDVICQRGKECYGHEGNCRFRAAIERNLSRYLQVKSRQEKSTIVSQIVGSVREASASASASIGGGFVRKDLLTRRWYRVDDKVAREKAGQALRDAIKSRRTSAKKRESAVHEATHEDLEKSYHNSFHLQASNGDVASEASSVSGDGGTSSFPTSSTKRTRRNDGVEQRQHSMRQESTFSSNNVHCNDDAPSDWANSHFEGNLCYTSTTRNLPSTLPRSLPTDQNVRYDSSTHNIARPPGAPAQHFFESQLASELEPRPILNSSTNDQSHPLRVAQSTQHDERGIDFFRYLYKSDESCWESIDELPYDSNFFVSSRTLPNQMDYGARSAASRTSAQGCPQQNDFDQSLPQRLEQQVLPTIIDSERFVMGRGGGFAGERSSLHSGNSKSISQLGSSFQPTSLLSFSSNDSSGARGHRMPNSSPQPQDETPDQYPAWH